MTQILSVVLLVIFAGVAWAALVFVFVVVAMLANHGFSCFAMPLWLNVGGSLYAGWLATRLTQARLKQSLASLPSWVEAARKRRELLQLINTRGS